MPPLVCYYRYMSSAERQVSGQKDSYLELKAYVLEYYGGGVLACIKCGFTDLKALTVDYANGVNGNGRRSTNMYWWLKANDFPAGYRTLCTNCQRTLKNGDS